MESYECLISELLQGGTPKEQYEFLVHLLKELNDREIKINEYKDFFIRSVDKV